MKIECGVLASGCVGECEELIESSDLTEKEDLFWSYNGAGWGIRSLDLTLTGR
jgi:hypothetical protein